MKVSLQKAFTFFYRTGFELENLSFDFYELVYFINGDGRTTINNESYTYSPHMICFTQPGDVRQHICIKKTEYICIRFNINDFHLNLDTGLYQCHTAGILDLFKKISKEFTSKGLAYYDICNLNISEVLFQMLRLRTASIEDQAILSLIKDMDQRPLYNKSVQEMADSVSYSYDHFRHKFKEITGQPPATYIILKRIEFASDLLLESDSSCTEIANQCGFSSSAQFSSLFKKYVGVAPLSFKHSYRGLK